MTERSQAERERDALRQGAMRVRADIENNERRGRAYSNAYAQPLYRRWVILLRDRIQETLTTDLGKAGRRAAHVAMLQALDPTVAAFCAVRVVIVTAMQADAHAMDARRLAGRIGGILHQEMILSVFEGISPDLFYTITRDLDRRHSRASAHRFNALKGGARNQGLTLPSWRQEAREQLGMWMLEALRVLGMVEVLRQKQGALGRTVTRWPVELTGTARQLIERVNALVEISRPWRLPCVEPPRDWTAFDDGGWHSVEMRRTMPFCINVRRVHGAALLDRLRKADMSRILPAINHLQAVRWAVNRDMLGVIQQVSRSALDLEEVPSARGPVPPPRPAWLGAPEQSMTPLSPPRQAQFTQWKRDMAQYYTQRKLGNQRRARLATALRVATEYQHYDALYFVYQADFRGRLYAQTTGISPQGSDMQRALLRFAQGKPLATVEAVRWFKIAGANRFGVDRCTLDERVAWVDAQHAHLLAFAADPTAHTGWTEASKPLQFLAWVREYAAWVRDPGAFVSHLPVGLDGSCNGLQHFSAMLRDAVGGSAVNLTAGAAPRDIYAQVAQVTRDKLTVLEATALDASARVYRQCWLDHGIDRTLVKRSVMTLPYGATRYTCADFILRDYLATGAAASHFAPAQYAGAANFLSHLVWEAIGEVVIAAAAAMVWLQQCANRLMQAGQASIDWTTPSGFPVVQVYHQHEEIRVRAKLFGGCQIRVHRPVDRPKRSAHKNGLAPNFVHSMDAAHLTLTVRACQAAGIDSLAMIHDDYGTHAADTPALCRLIRQTFVEMYENHDPIQDFFSRYPGLPPPPRRGDLDIRQVLRSPFFFA